MAPIKTPAIIIAFIAHSFGVGDSHETAVGDADPDLTGTPADSYIWNHTTGAWAAFQLETGTGNSNSNTHPDWNSDDTDKAAQAQMILRAARDRYPGEDIYLLPLARFGATMTKVTGSVFNERAISAIDNTTVPTEVLITLGTGPGGALNVGRAGPITAILAGITGLSPAINGTKNCEVRAAGNQIVVAETVTGAPSFGSATVDIEQGSWDATQTDNNALYPDWVTSVTAAYEALWAADLAPDPRALLVNLGVNDVTYDVATEFEAAMLAFVTTVRELLRVSEGVDIPIVWLEPIVAPTTSGVALSRRLEIRAALRQKAIDDPKFETLNVDTVDSALDCLVQLKSDALHPTYRGFMELALRMVRALKLFD